MQKIFQSFDVAHLFSPAQAFSKIGNLLSVTSVAKVMSAGNVNFLALAANLFAPTVLYFSNLISCYVPAVTY
jgi:hypothetical protein